jgi:hypothetical protein
MMTVVVATLGFIAQSAILFRRWRRLEGPWHAMAILVYQDWWKVEFAGLDLDLVG